MNIDIIKQTQLDTNKEAESINPNVLLENNNGLDDQLNVLLTSTPTLDKRKLQIKKLFNDNILSISKDNKNNTIRLSYGNKNRQKNSENAKTLFIIADDMSLENTRQNFIDNDKIMTLKNTDKYKIGKKPITTSNKISDIMTIYLNTAATPQRTAS